MILTCPNNNCSVSQLEYVGSKIQRFMTFCIQIAMEGIPSSGTRPPDLFFIASILIFDAVCFMYIYIYVFHYMPSYSNIFQGGLNFIHHIFHHIPISYPYSNIYVGWYSNILGLLKLLQGGAPEQLGAKLQHGTGQKLGFEAVGGQGNLGLLGSLQGWGSHMFCLLDCKPMNIYGL